MCGICGKFTFDRRARVDDSLVRSMTGTLSHRGPDGEGIYVSEQVGLGHTRLAIIDVAGGHQPLSNEDDTVWITFNGEIYNYQELAVDLLSKGHTFRTRSDTEVIVHLYEEYGPACVEKLRGMFAFGIWDERKKVLLLARDRVGIKPLYYSLTDKSLVFGSEIKAILADPEVAVEIQPEMIDRFLTFYYMPGEETLFRNIHKLPPGCYLIVENGRATVHKYWDLDFTTGSRSLQQASEELEQLFEESVRLHMISEVPVGLLLSGGVDSAAVLAFATGSTDHRLSTYTLGFDVPGVVDERRYARLTAEAYGSEHHDLTISAKEFQDFLPKYIWHMEEPVCEPPGVALYYVSKLASNYVKVLLAGEGGDEAFGGYQNYRSLLWLERIKRVLGPFKGVASAALRGFSPPSKIAKFAPLLNRPFESYYYSRTSGPLDFFNAQMSAFYTKDFAGSIDKRQTLQPLTDCMAAGPQTGIVNRMLYVDTKTWLTDDLLVKADKMTMANSVELRVPLLDHKLLEFAASLPGNYKVRNFTTKYIAKRVLERRIPQEILNRPKTGFVTPYTQWIKAEMKEWLSDLLFDRETTDRGYFRKKAVEKLVSENTQTGKHSRELFSLAVLELWHRTFLNKKGSPPEPREMAAALNPGSRN